MTVQQVTQPVRVDEALVREIPFGRPMIGEAERAAVADVLAGSTLTHGPRVEQFERDFAAFTGAAHAVATGSCTAALHLAYLHLGLGPGDEVIVPALTHVATAHAVELCGARCVFVDSEPQTGNIDLSQLESAINAATRAISVVHFLGLPVQMDTVMRLAKRHDLMVVEDCALAVGASYDGRHVGRWGDLGAFSFYPVKHITTGEGGMLISERDDVATSAARQRAFGIDRNIVSRRPQPGQYDVLELGHNYRMTEISGAMGVEQMRRLPQFLQWRKENYRALSRHLAQVDEIRMFLEEDERRTNGYYCHCILLDESLEAHRGAVLESLKANGIGASVYYPKPVPHMSYFQAKYGAGVDDFPEASRISRSAVALPVGPHLADGDLAVIAEAIKEAIHSVKRR